MSKSNVRFFQSKQLKKMSKKNKASLPISRLATVNIESLLTPHAKKRMAQRAISLEGIVATMLCGTFYHARGAEIVVIGKKECRSSKYDLTPYRGIHVVIAAGKIITAYTNKTVQLRYRR